MEFLSSQYYTYVLLPAFYQCIWVKTPIVMKSCILWF